MRGSLFLALLKVDIVEEHTLPVIYSLPITHTLARLETKKGKQQGAIAEIDIGELLSLSDSDFLGEVHIAVEDLLDEAPVEMWFPLRVHMAIWLMRCVSNCYDNTRKATCQLMRHMIVESCT